MSSFGRHDGGSAPPGRASLGVWFFDCLHLDGDDLLDRPLAERPRRSRPVGGALAIPASSPTTRGGRSPSSTGARRRPRGRDGEGDRLALRGRTAGKAWRKVKPVRTLDLVVLAAEWGHGRRQGWLSNLHLGARDGRRRRVRDGGQDVQGPHRRAARVADRGAPGPGVGPRHAHVVDVRPELVVEIALDGVQASTRYAGGVALRFARVRRYRDDKDPADADTIEAVRAMLPAE